MKPETYSEPRQTSKMEVFVKKVRGRRQSVLDQLYGLWPLIFNPLSPLLLGDHMKNTKIS